jgi:hypothetical protein
MAAVTTESGVGEPVISTLQDQAGQTATVRIRQVEIHWQQRSRRHAVSDQCRHQTSALNLL